jgi:hypothetical protein
MAFLITLPELLVATDNAVGAVLPMDGALQAGIILPALLLRRECFTTALSYAVAVDATVNGVEVGVELGVEAVIGDKDSVELVFATNVGC